MHISYIFTHMTYVSKQCEPIKNNFHTIVMANLLLIKFEMWFIYRVGFQKKSLGWEGVEI
jgi:hypothetical protein